MFKNKIHKEAIRKLVHLSSMWIPIHYHFFQKINTIFITLFILILCLIFDYLKTTKGKINKIIHKLKIDFILRDHEKNRLTGASNMMISAFILSFIEYEFIKIAGMSVLIISDAASAIFGMLYGKKKIYGEKTLVGSLAFFITAYLTSILIIELYNLNLKYYLIFFISCLIATVFELFAKKIKIDDNLLIPISFVLVVYIAKAL